MSNRPTEKTIEQAFKRLPKKILDAAVKNKPLDIEIKKAGVGVPIAHLFGAYPELRQALDSLDDSEFIHTSVAAVYCERSETVFSRHLKKSFGTPSELEKEGKAASRKRIRRGKGINERYFRTDLVRAVKEKIQDAEDNKTERKIASAQAKAASQTTEVEKLSRMKIWILDEADNVIASLGAAVQIEGKLLSTLLGKKVRFEVFSFQQAMTERQWASPAVRDRYEAIYLAQLDAERAQVVRMGDELRALAQSARLDAILPPAKRARTPKTPIRM